MTAANASVGCVVIGRNEGERLLVCLRSLQGRAQSVVYVDSGSSDGSVAAARGLGVEVVELDPQVPFTAARARNAGFERLLRILPDAEFVQFVDGDCEVVPGWIELAEQTLTERRDLGVVCGRRRERFPDASIYNRLCDIEWNTPVGSALACGGDALMRVRAFEAVGGFNPEIIAGEEPELCVRLRAQGWGIERLDAEMTLHDASMTRASQWWRRAVRGGHAFAEGAHLHGAPPERHWVKESRRALAWGALLPAVALAAAPLTPAVSVGLLSLYPLSASRTYRRMRGQGLSPQDAAAYAASMTLIKVPEALGAARFHAGRLLNWRARIIEYKRQR